MGLLYSQTKEKTLLWLDKSLHNTINKLLVSRAGLTAAEFLAH